MHVLTASVMLLPLSKKICFRKNNQKTYCSPGKTPGGHPAKKGSSLFNSFPFLTTYGYRHKLHLLLHLLSGSKELFQQCPGLRMNGNVFLCKFVIFHRCSTGIILPPVHLKLRSCHTAFLLHNTQASYFLPDLLLYSMKHRSNIQNGACCAPCDEAML